MVLPKVWLALWVLNLRMRFVDRVGSLCLSNVPFATVGVSRLLGQAISVLRASLILSAAA